MSNDVNGNCLQPFSPFTTFDDPLRMGFFASWHRQNGKLFLDAPGGLWWVVGGFGERLRRSLMLCYHPCRLRDQCFIDVSRAVFVRSPLYPNGSYQEQTVGQSMGQGKGIDTITYFQQQQRSAAAAERL